MESIAREAFVFSELEAIFESTLRLQGLERSNNARELNVALRHAPVGQAPTVLQLLEQPDFRALEDPLGNSCRAVAVGALLRFGFPWALHISPEDLFFARARNRGAWSTGALGSAIALGTLAAAVCVLGLLWSGVGWLAPPPQGPQLFLGGVLMALYGGLGVVAPLLTPRRASLRTTAAWGLMSLGLQAVMIGTSGATLLFFSAAVTAVLTLTSFSLSFAMPATEPELAFQ